MGLRCRGPEVVLALVGAARRMGIVANALAAWGMDRVIIRDGDVIAAMLTRMGARDAVLAWQEGRLHSRAQATARRLVNFDDAI